MALKIEQRLYVACTLPHCPENNRKLIHSQPWLSVIPRPLLVLRRKDRISLSPTFLSFFKQPPTPPPPLLSSLPGLHSSSTQAFCQASIDLVIRHHGYRPRNLGYLHCGSFVRLPPSGLALLLRDSPWLQQCSQQHLVLIWCFQTVYL